MPFAGIKNILVALPLVLTFSLAQGQELLDKIVAQLGDHVVLRSDLMIRMQEMQSQDPSAPVPNVTECQILEQMLFEHLLLNQAELDSVEISEDRVIQEIDRRLNYFQSMMGGREKLEEFYGKTIAQIKDEFYEKIEEQMKVEEMRNKITADVSASPQQIRDFFNGIPSDSLPYVNAKVTIAHLVMFPRITTADEKKVENQLMKVREQILAGEVSFESAAIRYSEDPGSAAESGDLGWQEKGTMVKEFESTIFSLKEGEVSVPVQTEYGFHLIKLIERRGSLFHAKHILIRVKPSDAAITAAAISIDSIYQQIEKGNLTFEDAVTRFSMDKNSNKNRGVMANPMTGDIEWDMKDLSDLDPSLVSTVNTLSIGGITQPMLYTEMQTNKEGFRIVKLVKRTPPHIANLEDDWSLIKMAADNNLKQQAINDWILGKIQYAFIRIDPDYSCAGQFQYDWSPQEP